MKNKAVNIKGIFKEFSLCSKLLDKKRKLYLYSLCPIKIFLILLEFVTTGALAILLSIIVNPEWVSNKPILQKIYQLLEFTSYNYFLLFLGICSITLFVSGTFAKYIAGIINLKLSQILTIHLSNIIIKNAVYNSYEWFLNQNTGTFSHATRNQANGISGFMLSCLNLCLTFFSLLIVFVFLCIQDPVLFLVFAFFIGGLSFLLNQATKNKLYVLGRKVNILSEKTGLVIREMLTGIIDIKIHQQERYFLKKYHHALKETQKINFITAIIRNALNPILTIFLYSGILVFLVYNIVFFQSLERIITSGALFLAVSYRALPYIQSILGTIGAIQNQIHGIINLKKLDLLKLRATPVDKNLSFKEIIRLENVSYSYPQGQRVFQPLSFTIKKNQTIGIIGKTGCGKSTLAKLLLGVLPISEGAIFVDQYPLTLEYQQSWYSKVSYVSQRIFIFNGSLLDNIVLGKSQKINRQKMDYIASFSWMKQFLSSLSNGINTTLNEDGSNLSGGQIQRLAIARAIYKDPEVFVFDEATNSLDNDTEQLILDTINNLQNKKTIVSIAHRLTTLKNADSIYQFKHKKLIHYDSYEKMLENQ